MIKINNKIIINKIYSIAILNILILLLSSCQKYDIENGNFFVKAKSEQSEEHSIELAKSKIYEHIAEYISDKTKRTDTNIIYYTLLDSDILLFDGSNSQIISKKSSGSYNTSIKINDSDINSKVEDFIISFQRGGKTYIDDKPSSYRANASIDYPDITDLYTKSILQKDAFRRAIDSIRKELLADGLSEDECLKIIDNAYIVEETFGQKTYTVVVEVSL